MCQITQMNNNFRQVPMYATIPSLPFMNPDTPLLFPQLTANASQPGFVDPVLSMQPRRGEPPRKRRMINEREKFLLLTKMILLYLEHSYNTELLEKAKQVIQGCIYHNRQGESQFMPLKNAIETRLEALLGVDFFNFIQRSLEANCENTPYGYSFITQRNTSPTAYA